MSSTVTPHIVSCMKEESENMNMDRLGKHQVYSKQLKLLGGIIKAFYIRKHPMDLSR